MQEWAEHPPNCTEGDQLGDYRKLDVWIASRQLAKEIYLACESMPSRDRYELASQMRRAVISVVSNIAEGSGRAGDLEFARFLRIARGSVTELEAQLVIAGDLAAIDTKSVGKLVNKTIRVRRMLSGLLRKLRDRRPQSPQPSALSR
jgi:four helix bundle protein